MLLTPGTIEKSERVLDVGGWFKPEPRATHVVDLMPWETRAGRVQMERLPDERFSRETWYQADFLAPDFRLPFDDRSFDVVLCGQTVEDLRDPRPLLCEMSRVGKTGVIECPSRLHEQTVGVRDRKCGYAGHPHHHWIVEASGGRILLYSKTDSRMDRVDTMIPLFVYERLVREKPGSETLQVEWRDNIEFEIIFGEECFRRAREFSKGIGFSDWESYADRAIRAGRRFRDLAKGRGKEDFSWWEEIVRKSEPFSRIKLK